MKIKEDKLKREFYGTESEFIELLLNKDYDELKELGYDDNFIDFAHKVKLEMINNLEKEN